MSRHAEAARLSIGIVGADSAHAEEFAALLRQPPYLASVRIISTAPDAAILAKVGCAPDLIVHDWRGLARHTDAVLITTRHFTRKANLARRLLLEGVPVFLDKPLAHDLNTARTLAALARRSNVLLDSSSALRWAPGVQAAADRHRRSPIRSLRVSGPANIRGNEDLFFYGVHLVEMTLEILGNPEFEIADAGMSVFRKRKELIVSLRIGPTSVRMSFQSDVVAPRPGFAFEVDDELRATPVPLDAQYLEPVLARFISAVTGASSGPALQRLLKPIEVLECVRLALVVDSGHTEES